MIDKSEVSDRQGTILVVDDLQDNIRLLSAMLAEKGFKVRKALNGKTALKTAKKTPPDLILLDINMPNQNGYEVCEELKADEETREIPVIFISALDDVLDKVKAFQVGGVDYITKPFQGEEVLARVQNQLFLRQQKQELAEKNAQLEQEIRYRVAVEEALRREQQKSEALLLNILPQSIAERLKQDRQAIADRFDEVTILFADIVGFTPLAARISPKELVALLDKIFSIFDELAEKHDLEKIKTIGDAYMVVGGLPVPKDNHAEAIAAMALDMQKAIAGFQPDIDQLFQIRIGINTGSVVAGVIGIRKFSYDLWGDAVNVASRMESSGEPGKIHVTAKTYQCLKDKYAFQERGAIVIKGKGNMTTYWLLGRKEG